MLRTGDILEYRTLYSTEVVVILGTYRDNYIYCNLMEYEKKRDTKKKPLCQLILIENKENLGELKVGYDEKVKIDIIKRVLQEDSLVVLDYSGDVCESKDLKYKEIEILE